MSDDWDVEDTALTGSPEEESALQDLAAELADLARAFTREDVYLLDPPGGLWDSIHAATMQSPPVTASPPATASPAGTETTSAPGPKLVSISDAHGSHESDAAGPGRGRWSRPTRFAAAAAVAAVLATGGAILASQRDDAGQLVAQAEITNEGLPVVFAESGSAQVRRDGSDLYLSLKLPDLPSTRETDAFYEVWMIDTDVAGMVSLGVVPRDGRVDLPDDMDPSAFPVVDISVEPLDGDPTHSGQSILRGLLDEEA